MFTAIKSQRWIPSQAVSKFHSWCKLNGISFDGVEIAHSTIEGGGGGVLATRRLTGGNEAPLMAIPRDMVLSRERVELQAKGDKWLREVLDAAGDYGRVSFSNVTSLSLMPLYLLLAISNCFHPSNSSYTASAETRSFEGWF